MNLRLDDPIGQSCTFNIGTIGTLSGRIVDYKVTADAVPIIFELEAPNGTRYTIPWVSVNWIR